MTAYSPMGTPPSSAMFKDYQPALVMNDPVVKELAKKYNKNVGQACLTSSAVSLGYLAVLCMCACDHLPHSGD